MTDPLNRVCGLLDLSFDDRQRLLAELTFVTDLFTRIDRGAGFCEDRGFGWGAAQERAEGSDRLFDRLREWPILRRLLPAVRHLRHEHDPVLAYAASPADDVLVARLILTNNREFGDRYGKEWAETYVRVRMDPDMIRVREEATATALNGTPIHFSDDEADYSAERSGDFWHGLRDKLSADTWRQAAALAGRRAGVKVPCDQCGRTAQSLALVGRVLTVAGPFSAPLSVEASPDVVAALRQAFAAHDMPAVRAMNPDWAEAYCEACDASYCRGHLKRERRGANDLRDLFQARCPHGHCWNV